jgi:hypothetical protein
MGVGGPWGVNAENGSRGEEGLAPAHRVRFCPGWLFPAARGTAAVAAATAARGATGVEEGIDPVPQGRLAAAAVAAAATTAAAVAAAAAGVHKGVKAFAQRRSAAATAAIAAAATTAATRGRRGGGVRRRRRRCRGGIRTDEPRRGQQQEGSIHDLSSVFRSTPAPDGGPTGCRLPVLGNPPYRAPQVPESV